MRWDAVVRDTIDRLKNDTALTTLLGGPHIYRSRTRSSIQIPGIYWSVIYEGVEENLAPVNIQWDIFATSATEQAAIEKRLYDLMHSDNPVQYATLLMWSQFLSRFDKHDDDQGEVLSGMEFKYTPSRDSIA
jgi:hypothetical protein